MLDEFEKTRYNNRMELATKAKICFNAYGTANALYWKENDNEIHLALFDGFGSVFIIDNESKIYDIMKNSIREEQEGYVVFSPYKSKLIGAYWRTKDKLFRVKLVDNTTDLFENLIQVRMFFDKIIGKEL